MRKHGIYRQLNTVCMVQLPVSGKALLTSYPRASEHMQGDGCCCSRLQL